MMEQPENTGKRILIVEDEHNTAASMADLLEALGCETLIATDGVKAVRMATEFHPNIVLLDIALPGMNGYEVTQALRTTPALSAVLIVAISGYGEPEDKRKAYNAGIDLHLTNPVIIYFLKQLISVYGSCIHARDV